MKKVMLFGGVIYIDHVHMYIAILRKRTVLEFVSRLKGICAVIVFDAPLNFVQSG